MNHILERILQTQTAACPDCGSAHRTPLQEVCIDNQYTAALGGWVGSHTDWTSVAVVADIRTWDAAGKDAATALRSAGLQVVETIVPDPGPGGTPMCDEQTRDAVKNLVGDVDGLAAAGSGVINDLSKWVAGDLGITYACVATAPSMNGYASDNIAATVRGVKVLERGRGPIAIFASPRILAAAPAPMRQAGAGDVIAKAVSSADWLLNHRLFGSYYCPQCVKLSEEAEQLVYTSREGLATGDERATGDLFNALLLTGVAMSFAGTSAPASGGEHLISHALDMMAARDGVRHDLHGRQVGVGTVLAAALYEAVLSYDGSDGFAIPPDMEGLDFWGCFEDEVASHWRRKKQALLTATAALNYQPSLWQQLKAELRQAARPPEFVTTFLRDAGATASFSELGIEHARFREAVLHARQIRDRFTILDLAWLTGVLPSCLDGLVERWLT